MKRRTQPPIVRSWDELPDKDRADIYIPGRTNLCRLEKDYRSQNVTTRLAVPIKANLEFLIPNVDLCPGTWKRYYRPVLGAETASGVTGFPRKKLAQRKKAKKLRVVKCTPEDAFCTE